MKKHKTEKLIRFNCWIKPSQKKNIVSASKRLKVSQNEIVRIMLDDAFAK